MYKRQALAVDTGISYMRFIGFFFTIIGLKMIKMCIRDRKELIPLERSEGRISSEFAYLYPPGIPLLVPGERISTRFINQAESWKKQGIYLCLLYTSRCV